MYLSIEKLLQSIGLPKRYFDNESNISEKFSEEMKRFFLLLDNCSGEEFDQEKKDQINEGFSEVKKIAQAVFDYLIKIFENYESSDFKNAQELMDMLMFLIKDDVFVGSIYDVMSINNGGNNVSFRLRGCKDSTFFRVRAVDERSDMIENNPDGLFHIPYSKRSFSNNERFSLAEFPSLYLSTKLPLAWQECKYPQKYYYSEYKYSGENDEGSDKCSSTNDWKFLLLYSPQEIYEWGFSLKHNDFSLWLKVITRYLKTYPLILACSFVNLSKNVTFKQEYIIPQMLMQWVLRNHTEISGIEYFSCIDKLTQTSEWHAYNIAIPARKPFDDKNYSLPLRRVFTWSSPKYYNIPIFDKEKNKNDREFLYDFVSNIWGLLKKYLVPRNYAEQLLQMVNLSGTMTDILEMEENIDMQMVLHVLNVLQDNIMLMKNLHLEKDIYDKIKNDKDFPYENDEITKNLSDSLSDIFSGFFDLNSGSNSVLMIIKKYANSCWKL